MSSNVSVSSLKNGQLRLQLYMYRKNWQIKTYKQLQAVFFQKTTDQTIDDCLGTIGLIPKTSFLYAGSFCISF